MNVDERRTDTSVHRAVDGLFNSRREDEVMGAEGKGEHKSNCWNTTED